MSNEKPDWHTSQGKYFSQKNYRNRFLTTHQIFDPFSINLHRTPNYLPNKSANSLRLLQKLHLHHETQRI